MFCKVGGQMLVPSPHCAQPMIWRRTLSLVSTRQEGDIMSKFTFEPLAVPDLIVIKPTVHGDARGFFLETYRADEFAAAGITTTFVQSNHSHSTQGVLRGLHFQKTYPQAKLIRCMAGRIFDVGVDLRPGSQTYSRWAGVELSSGNHWSLFIPKGFAHGFLVLSPEVDVEYQCAEYYHPEDEGGLLWNDPTVSIAWAISVGSVPLLSGKDQQWPTLTQWEKK
jgi:dTDP-4-dehydrorhamnose 3,5-epimerase